MDVPVGLYAPIDGGGRRNTVREQGYPCAVVGGVGPRSEGFYQAMAGATLIGGSDPGP